MNIKEIRQKYPQYNDMSDTEFADAFHGKYYSDIPKEDFYKTLGISKGKTNIWEDVKSGFTGAANTLDTVATLGVYAPIAAAYKGDRVLPKIVDELNARKKLRTEVANPEGKEQGLSGKLISAVPQIITSPLSPAETAQTFMDKGESPYRAAGAGLVDAAGNALGLVLPAVGGNIVKRVVGGGAVNAAQEYAAKRIQQDIAQKESTKKAFEPTLEDLAVAGIIGGGFGVLGSNRKGNKKKELPPTKNMADVEASMEPPKAPPVPEQLELPLETSAQSISEMQNRGNPQMDLFETATQPHERAPTIPDAVEPPAPRYGEQPELDFGPIEQDISTYRADQYGGGQGYGVIDENGVPIRADLSMEAANLENPLQMNMWGDELGPALDQTRSLTESIDKMRETGRTAQGKFMPKEFLADTFGRELDTPVPKDMAKEGPFSVERDPTATRPGQYMRSQQGAIHPRVFEDLYNFGKSVVRGAEGLLMPVYHGTTKEINGDFKTARGFNDYRGKENRAYPGDLGTWFSSTPAGTDTFAGARTGISGGNVHQAYLNLTNPKVFNTHPEFKAWFDKQVSDGRSASSVRRQLVKEGHDGIQIKESKTDGGGTRQDFVAFKPDQIESAISPKGYNRFGQGGGQTILNDIAGAAVDAFRKIKGLTAKSPEVIEAKKQLEADAKKQRVQAIINGKDSGYLENVTTPEAVIAAAEKAKDISKSQAIGGKTVSPGINHLAVKTNNPLVKFMRAKTREVFVEADRLTEQFVTGQDGIGKVIQDLSKKERVEVVQLLQLGDKKQTKITRDVMQKHGFSEKQIEFVEKFYEMDQFKFDTWNQKRAEAGKEPVKERTGHVPGIFKGDYKQLVLSPDGKPLGVIAVDFKWQLEAARKSMLEKFPDAKFSPMRRSSLGGSSGRSGEFGAMQELLTMLAEKDPSFKEVQALISQAIVNEADKAYGAASHALAKKGIVGNEGNKPWLSPERNADDFIKAYLQHWEDQMISHLALPVEENVRSLMQNPALDKMGNAKDYVDNYLKNMTGRSTGQVGQALNTLIDTPARLAGIGPTGTREVVQQFNKRMGQYSMGFGNLLFSVTQWMQLAQTGMPELTAAAKQMGINQTRVIPAMTRAMIDMVSQTVKDPTPELKATLDEAKARGLMTFSEFTDVSKITQGKASATFDKIVDFNRAELGEKPTRPLMFRAAVLLLKDAGLEGKALYDAAYNVTQAGMFDYRMNERPMMYQRMGVAGQLAGGLQTFKHAYLGQLNRFGSNGLKDPVTATLSLSALVGYAGIMGLPFYQELDQLFQLITEKSGKRYTISEYAMEEMPRWLKYGAVSDITNVNMQGRLSSADVLPNSPLEAVSPWFSPVGRIAGAAADTYKFNDELAWSNLGTQLAPQGPLKGLAEKSFLTDDEGYVLNREGLRGNVRTEWDKNVRTYTGGRSLDEAITGENQYNSGQRLKAYRDTQKSVMERVKREYVQGTLSSDKLKEYADKYVKSQGDISRFVRELEQFAMQADMDKQQRLQGIPNSSMGSLYRFQEYQDDVEK